VWWCGRQRGGVKRQSGGASVVESGDCTNTSAQSQNLDTKNEIYIRTNDNGLMGHVT